MDSARILYGNCSECKVYDRLNADRRCIHCARHERKLLRGLKQLIRNNPDVSQQEIVDTLGIDRGKIENWVEEGKARCVRIDTQCPVCGRKMLNHFSCRDCGFDLAEELRASIRACQPIDAPLANGSNYSYHYKKTTSFSHRKN